MNFLEKTIRELIKNKVRTPKNLAKTKRKIAKQHKITCPDNISLLRTYHEMVKNKSIKSSETLEGLLITRPVRSLSGIVNVSVLTKPYPCPGKCIYCPTEKGIPKSYVSGEPAVERAKKLKYNPYLQTSKRIKMLKREGHPTDKIEIRVVGGTWSYYPKQYQRWFVKRCFDACNKKNSKNIREAQKRNEKANHRIVGLSIETRPDFINKKEIKTLRELGVTMVELGVQSVFDDILKLSLRGHGVKETILATKLLKDAGFKILYQIMPNLPGSCIKKDEKMFTELFRDPRLRPDFLKIYPCALLKRTRLYQWWQKGKFKPCSEKQLLSLLKSIKTKVPYYVRIQRIARDIPSSLIACGGAKTLNLRQILAEKMKKEKWFCKCIRCREVRANRVPKEKTCFFRQDYMASGGKEIFLSLENKDRSKLYSLLRLRIPSFVFKPIENQALQDCRVLKNTAIIREIHTYGEVVPISRTKIAVQHQGLGKRLIKEAEKITKQEFNLRKISVISGVGARGYFRKLGYKLQNTYMIKILK